MSDQRQIIFRADAALVDALSAAAEERGISRNVLTLKLISEGLESLLPADQVRYTSRTTPRHTCLPGVIGWPNGCEACGSSAVGRDRVEPLPDDVAAQINNKEQ